MRSRYRTRDKERIFSGQCERLRDNISFTKSISFSELRRIIDILCIWNAEIHLKTGAKAQRLNWTTVEGRAVQSRRTKPKLTKGKIGKKTSISVETLRRLTCLTAPEDRLDCWSKATPFPGNIFRLKVLTKNRLGAAKTRVPQIKPRSKNSF